MNTITINGITYTGGRNIQVNGDNILIDGKDVTPDSKNITVVIDGNYDGDLDLKGARIVEVKGNSGSIHTVSGDIDVTGDVQGSASTVSGDIKANSIGGSCSTVSGDIKTNKPYLTSAE